jgi:hypothetical protein
MADVVGLTDLLKTKVCCLMAGNPRRNISVAWIVAVVSTGLEFADSG